MTFPNRQVATLMKHAGPVHCVTFSAGLGQYILTGAADRSIRLFNPLKTILPGSVSSSRLASSSLIQTYSAHGYEVLDIAVTDDNARFASVGGDRQVFLWDVTTAKTLRRWGGHGARVNAVGFGGDGDCVVVSGEAIRVRGNIAAVINADTLGWSGSYDATVRLWDCKSQSTKPIQTFEEAKDSVSSLHILGHELCTGSVDGNLRLYDLRMGIVHVDVIGQPITSVQQTRDGNAVLVSTLNSTIRLMDKGNGQMLQCYKGHTNQYFRIRSCLGLGDSVIISGSEDGQLFAWDMLEGKVIQKLKAHGGKVVSAIAWNEPKKEWASAGTDGTVHVWGMP